MSALDQHHAELADDEDGPECERVVFNETLRRQFASAVRKWSAINEARAERKSLTYDGILLESVFSLLAVEEENSLAFEANVSTAEIQLEWLDHIEGVLKQMREFLEGDEVAEEIVVVRAHQGRRVVATKTVFPAAPQGTETTDQEAQE